MAELKRCEKCGKISSWSSYFNGYMCECGNIERKATTNADRIRAMSDDELARFMNLCGHDFPPYCDVESSISGECDQNCIKCAEKWLKQPAEE